jgi:YD repeat-containing protein
MKPLYPLLYLLTTSCIISSCKKDIKEHIDPSQEGTVLIGHNMLNGVDQLEYRSFIRNAAGQLTAFRDSLNVAYNARTFEYDVNGNLTRVNLYNDNGDRIGHFALEYNNNGQVIKRLYSNPANQPAGHNIFTYDGAGKLVSDSNYALYSTGDILLSTVTRFHYTGDNITEAEFYLDNGTDPAILSSKVKYTYDNKLNPLKKIPNYYCLTALSAGIYFSRYESKNNVVKEYHASRDQPYELRFTYKYKYNLSNYPYRQEPGYDPRGKESKQVEFFYKQ